VARPVDLVAVKLKLAGYPGVRALLTVEEQHARTTARVVKRVRVLLVMVGQRFLPAPRKDKPAKHGRTTIRS
jgi:hypothetical protein